MFDSGMTWHIEQGGLNLDRFVWLPTWEQCRTFLKQRGFSLQLRDHDQFVSLEVRREGEKMSAEGKTDLEALYAIVLEALKTRTPAV